MKNKNQKGFTLVELLVVIAIIGILAVVAVPALFKNINKAKAADLLADYNAFKSATLSYYSDTNDYPQGLTGLVSPNESKDLDEYMESVPTDSPFGGKYGKVDNDDLTDGAKFQITFTASQTISADIETKLLTDSNNAIKIEGNKVTMTIIKN
ncbi:prepilin-type N-terminal cleavage/methylation domain-containing protein [Romboutsia weinsteinii]|uniref:Prepilin-type N-terminal cleavage/methylation domain-containing protein n=1 Tax=Romboutsia weinsteinii TaxID=2020949 RepID=A0A371J1I0_9FIRM|nr:prepilin-type N-terminal cleavage/methylation domain-containing protein [Romboutsia weinsteinii]RDY26661.1 prepilin-type N-terminal cleavage/methylation domain-containing protein [Romboutsia weinsteinii]